MSNAALRLVQEEMEKDRPQPPKPQNVPMNLTVREPIRDEVQRLSEELGWSKTRVVSVAVQAFSRLVSEDK